MIVTFLRSSTYSGFGWCQQKYLISNVLGIPDKPNLAASKGTLTHKALELLARKKLAQQNNEPIFHEEETNTTWDTESFTPLLAINTAWDHYTKTVDHEWEAGDFSDCQKWMNCVLDFNNGALSPLKRQIIAPEHYFDFQIEKPWAWYNYKTPQGIIEGYMSVKGTVDLILGVDNQPDMYEYVDLKTGQRKDWNTGKRKEHDGLRDDPQFRLYHYALVHEFPHIKNFLFTVFYTADGGPFSIPFSKSDLPKTELMLKDRFDEIRSCVKPKLAMDNFNDRWKCTKLCEFYKNKWPESEKNVCKYIKDELISLGMEKVTNKYADFSKISNYGEGGGRSQK